MSTIISRIQNYAFTAFKWLKNLFVKPTLNWKSVGLVCVGGIAGIILSFKYAQKITVLTGLQLTGQIFRYSSLSKYNDIKYNNPLEWKKIIPTAPTRPSNELMSLVNNLKTIFTIDPSWTPQQHLNKTQKLFQQILPFSKMCPSYISHPKQYKHIINEKNNVNAYKLLVPGCDTSNGIIFYIHGGGFLVGRWDFALQTLYPLCKQTGMIGISLDYRLVNGSQITILEQVSDCVECYEYLLDKYDINKDNNKIYICGESGGAALTLLTLLEIRNKKLLQPKGCIAMSPICDLSLDSESVSENGQYDIVQKIAFIKPMQVAIGNMDMNGNIIQKNDIKSAKYSCKYANWNEIQSSLYIQSSAYEILRDDIRDTVENIKKANVNVQYEENLFCPHGVAAFADNSPETMEAGVRISDWINKLNNN